MIAVGLRGGGVQWGNARTGSKVLETGPDGWGMKGGGMKVEIGYEAERGEE